MIFFIKIVIIKVNTINVYSNKAQIIAKEYDNIKVYIIKVYIIIREYNIIEFFKFFLSITPTEERFFEITL